jgi:hypothetical protein
MLADFSKWVVSAVANVIGGPIAKTWLEAYKLRLEREGSQDQLLADLAARDLAVQQRELELRSAERLALIGHWYEPANLLGYVLVLYIAKVVLFDSMLGLGETPAIRGAVGDWLGMIATFFVGTRGAVSVASIFRRR